MAWGLTLRSRMSPSARHVEAGIEFTRKGKLLDAEKEWRNATVQDPNNALPWEYLAESYSDIHNWQGALEALHHLEHLKPDSPHLQARLAMVAMHTGDEMAAYKYADSSLKLEPNDQYTILLFCTLLANTGENQRRLDLLRHLVKLQPDKIETQVLLASTLTDKRQFDEARPLVEQILMKDPSNLDASSLRGMILLNTDSSPAGLKQAETAFLKTVATPHYAAFAHFNLGKIYKRMGKPKEAMPHLEEAVKLLPMRREVWFELAEASSQAGQTAKSEAARAQSELLLRQENAIKSLEKKCATNPEDFDAHLELTNRFITRSEFHKAEIHMERVKTLRPQDPRVQAAFQKLAAAEHTIPSPANTGSSETPDLLSTNGGR